MRIFWKRFTTNLALFRLIMKGSKTPLFTKLLVGIALIYLLSPFDFVPDFLIFIGIIDDAIIISLLILTALRIIPSDVIKKYRDSVGKLKENKIIERKLK